MLESLICDNENFTLIVPEGPCIATVDYLFKYFIGGPDKCNVI